MIRVLERQDRSLRWEIIGGEMTLQVAKVGGKVGEVRFPRAESD
jgi:hypothetical protein